ncbi:hypothetical protein BU17DRAFT_62267 [Hysterangium stoloniferum]|nr:hypothetical protein BU17DRAFT_62267 [Hysterangium stoloniferum]
MCPSIDYRLTLLAILNSPRTVTPHVELEVFPTRPETPSTFNPNRTPTLSRSPSKGHELFKPLPQRSDPIDSGRFSNSIPSCDDLPVVNPVQKITENLPCAPSFTYYEQTQRQLPSFNEGFGDVIFADDNAPFWSSCNLKCSGYDVRTPSSHWGHEELTLARFVTEQLDRLDGTLPTNLSVYINLLSIKSSCGVDVVMSIIIESIRLGVMGCTMNGGYVMAARASSPTAMIAVRNAFSWSGEVSYKELMQISAFYGYLYTQGGLHEVDYRECMNVLEKMSRIPLM